MLASVIKTDLIKICDHHLYILGVSVSDKFTLGYGRVIAIGIMLFALFFGAGNLIFPAKLGQLAGENVWEAGLGFIVTGVALPLLGVIALGFSGENDFLRLSQRAGVVFGLIFTTVLYLSIGPLFAMPRTGSVSFEMVVIPFLKEENQQIALFVFSIFYFALSYFLSINPTKIVDIVGKVLTPIMLIFIAILVIRAFMSPIGELQPAVTTEYQTQPFFEGFHEGYLTMDALASFIFGIIVVTNIKQYGVSSRKAILAYALKASFIAGTLLAIIYITLCYVGAMSVEKLGILDNGGKVLSGVSHAYFGSLGKSVLGVIVLMACLTTNIGLTVSCSTYATRLLPKVSYKLFAAFFSIISALFANFGLSQLISISVPVLVVVYPLTIVLVILTFTHSLFKGKRGVYFGSLMMTLAISLFSGLSMLGLNFESIQYFFKAYVPLYDVGLGWVVPAFIGGVIGYFCDRGSKKAA